MAKKMLCPEALDGFDVPAAVERMLDQPMLWWQAMEMFVQHFAGWDAAWQASRGDDAAERKLAHALRSAAANVGAVRLSAAAAALEKALQVPAGAAGEGGAELRQRLADEFGRTWRAARDACARHRQEPAA